MMTPDKIKRFWAKVGRGSDDDCWLWTGGTNPSGYGRFAAEGRRLFAAHRVSYELSGRPIADGMVIDHICRNRLCVNPKHLRAVDRLTNVHENSVALAHLNSLKSACPQGHPYSGDNLITRKSGRRRCRICTNAKRRKAARGASPPEWAGRASPARSRQSNKPGREM